MPRKLKIEQVESVYSGRHGCCCGCRGKHSYREDLIDRGVELRGYPFTAEDCSNRNVNRIITTINAAIYQNDSAVEVNEDYVAYDSLTHTYIAYLLKDNQ